MKNESNYVIEIPARLGSNRVKKKNIRLLNGKPMIAYAIDAAINSKRADKIYVNSDSNLIEKIALEKGINFYKRDEVLLIDSAKQDEFNYDFLKNIECESLVMVNPVSPLIEGVDIDSAIEFYEKNNLDTLISSKQEKLHAFFQGNPLNFCSDSLLAPTQEIAPVDILTWNICIWRRETFLKSFEDNGYAAFNGKVGMWPVDPMKSIKISYEEDFRMAEVILKAKENGKLDLPPQFLEED